MSIGSINPFTDPDFKNEILKKEGSSIKSSSFEVLDVEDCEFVDIDNSSNNAFSPNNLKSIISSAPKIPTNVKNVILDASAIAKSEKDARASEMSLALNDVFTKYNKQYNTDLQIDFSSLSRTLINVSDPKSRRTLELYLSEVFQSIRPILLLHMISKLTLAIDYILDPQRMLGGEMTIQDTFVAVEKIMQFIQQLEDMKRDIIVKGSDLELKKLSEEVNNNEELDDEAKEAINSFMSIFKKNSGIIE